MPERLIRLQKLIPGDHPLAVPPPNLARLDRRAAVVLAEARRGASVRKIATRFGVSPHHVRSWLIVHGPGYWPEQRILPLIGQMANDGMSASAIARRLAMNRKDVIGILFASGWTQYVDVSRIRESDWLLPEAEFERKYQLGRSQARTVRYKLGRYLPRYDIGRYAVRQRDERARLRQLAKAVTGHDLTWVCLRVLLALAQRGPSTIQEICAATNRRSPIDGELKQTFAHYLHSRGLIACEPRVMPQTGYRYWLTPLGLDALRRIISALGRCEDGAETDEQGAGPDPSPVGTSPRGRCDRVAHP